jgi:iron(III) transport system permease protein
MTLSATASPPAAPRNRPQASPDETTSARWLKRLARILSVRNVAVIAVVIVIGYLALVPLVYLLARTFFESGTFSLDGFARAYDAVGLGEMIWNSFVFAAGSALLALIVGTFLAYVTVRTDAPFPGLVFAASLVPLIIPGVLYTISWILLSSENIGVLNQLSNALVGTALFDVFSMPGMIWVEGTHNAPLVYLFMVAAFRSMDPSLEESALLSGASRATMLRRVTLPLVRPALAGAALIMVVRGLEGFDVPALLGIPKGIFVFTSRIFYEMQTFPIDAPAAGSLSITLLIIAIVGVWITTKSTAGRKGEFSTVTGKGFRPRPLELRRARPVVGLVVFVYFAVTTLLPVGILVYASLLPFYQGVSFDAFADMSFRSYEALFADRTLPRATQNSILLAVASAAIVVVLSAIAAWLIVRTKVRGRWIVDQLAFLPMVVPGIVLGLAIGFVYLRNPLPFQVYGTLLILLFAYVTRFMPYGMRYAISSLEQVAGELEESAQVSGASWWRTFTRILVPLILPGLFSGFLYTLIISVRELSSSILLYTPGNEVLAIMSWQLYEDGELTVVAALGVVMIVGLTLVVTVANLISSRLGVGAR